MSVIADATKAEMTRLAHLVAEARGPLAEMARWLSGQPHKGQRVTLPIGYGRVAVILTDEEHRRAVEEGVL